MVMGKATARKSTPKKQKPELTEVVGPTKEAKALGAYVRAGMAHRRIPNIDILREANRITDEQHRALSYYRDQCQIADRTLTKSCIDFSPKGDGHGPSAAIISASIEQGRMNRALGVLQSITYAIAVDDMSLSQWCVSRYGSKEECYERKGKVVCQIVPLRKKDIEIAGLELKHAAARLLGEIGARR